MRHLPPLVMLRAFEAAARHGSMSRAAVELNVTHGAVSRQIVALERRFGRRLFHRKARGVQLTEEGLRLFHGISSGFERIRVAVEDLRTDHERRRVTVATLPTLANRWLIPRLARFQALYPDILIHVRTGTELDDLADPAIDFAIRYGAGTWSNTTAKRLLSANAYPVCSPSFVARHGPFEGPAELLRLPLIHDSTRQWWVDWFLAAGIRIGSLNGGIVVDEYGLAVQFALDGYGIALARDPLLNRDLATGALTRLFDISVTPRFAYYLVHDGARQLSAEAELLMGWLLADRK